jgi:hypothetical protein
LRRMHPWNALFMAALGGLLTYDSSCDKRGHPQSPSYQNLSYCRVFLSLVLVFCWRFTAMHRPFGCPGFFLSGMNLVGSIDRSEHKRRMEWDVRELAHSTWKLCLRSVVYRW